MADTIRFYGASDDLVEVESVGNLEHEIEGLDEYSAIRNKSFVLDTSDGKFRVYATYDGCWSFALAQTTEDHEIPGDWMVEVRQKNGSDYSTELRITAPFIKSVWQENLN